MNSAANYSALDRFLHQLALGNLELQKSIADMEDRMHARALQRIRIERPVFITALPRAGTTLLLELVIGSGGFATHTYRDMPFVLCPLTWRSIARNFQQRGQRRERAHGDGMTVDFDSPEAFEEVIWKAFWPEKYAEGRIGSWSAADRKPEFEAAFRDHLRKVIILRSDGRAARYVSKNNAGIARLPLLPELYPDCVILIPFRDPRDHAESLARQHANFLSLHRQDGFARKYMGWIGHHEFGDTFLPFAFCSVPKASSADFDYWLEYWSCAYQHVLAHAPAQAVFLDYDRMCRRPESTLDRIAAAIGVPPRALQEQALRLRSPERQIGDRSIGWGARVRDIYDRLQERAV